MQLDIGLSEEQRGQVVDGLKRALADTYTLYLMTHRFHWNVTGRMFNTLHAMFEQQYNELWMAADEIAERIRALGEFSPGDYASFGELTSIDTTSDVAPDAQEMLRMLVKGHEALSRTARKVADTADDVDDLVTEDLMIGRMTISEKNAWMLRSML